MIEVALGANDVRREVEVPTDAPGTETDTVPSNAREARRDVVVEGAAAGGRARAVAVTSSATRDARRELFDSLRLAVSLRAGTTEGCFSSNARDARRLWFVALFTLMLSGPDDSGACPSEDGITGPLIVLRGASISSNSSRSAGRANVTAVFLLTTSDAARGLDSSSRSAGGGLALVAPARAGVLV